MALYLCERVLSHCDKTKIEHQTRKQTKTDAHLYITAVFYSKKVNRKVQEEPQAEAAANPDTRRNIKSDID